MEPKYRIELGTFYGRQRQINIIKNSSITLQGNHRMDFVAKNIMH